MARRSERMVERQRAYYQGELVTILNKGRRSSEVRTGSGFVIESVPNKQLDFNVDDQLATLRFEPPSG